MTSNFRLLFSPLTFQIHRFAMSTSRGRIDPGAVSGNETQFAFSEGDVRDSESDNRIVRPAPGWFAIPTFL